VIRGNLGENTGSTGWEFLSHVLPVCSEPVCVIDIHGSLRFVNHAAAAALGYDEPTDLEGKSGHDTLHPEVGSGSLHRFAECPFSRNERNDLGLRIEADRLLRRDGTTMNVELRTVPLFAPTRSGTVISFRRADSTKRSAWTSGQHHKDGTDESDMLDVLRRTNTRDNEFRYELARTIHDGIQQQIVNAMLFIRRAEQSWTEEPEESTRLIQAAATEAKTAITGLRELVNDLYAPILRTRGLEAGLETLCSRLPFPLTLDISPVPLSRLLRSNIYFMCADLLLSPNIGDTTTTSNITTRAHNERLAIEIRLEGSPERRPNADDLATMKERILALGGMIELVESSSAVMSFSIVVPL
jgi:PAS domain S-box-containing protein